MDHQSDGRILALNEHFQIPGLRAQRSIAGRRVALIRAMQSGLYAQTIKVWGGHIIIIIIIIIIILIILIQTIKKPCLLQLTRCVLSLLATAAYGVVHHIMLITSLCASTIVVHHQLPHRAGSPDHRCMDKPGYTPYSVLRTCIRSMATCMRRINSIKP